MRIHVLKDNLKLGLKKNSIVFIDNKIAIKAIESGCAKVYCDCEEAKEIIEDKVKSKKSKE